MKRILIVFLLLLIGTTGYWFSLDSSQRYLLLNPPEGKNILFWTTAQRDAGFRMFDKADTFPTLPIHKGSFISQLKQGEPLSINGDVIKQYMDDLRIASLLVMHNDDVVLENYGLNLTPDDQWTSFSVAKSFTSTLVGAAIKDGYIESLDDKVSQYLPDMKGSVYDNVSIQQLLTMTSGVAWNEDYSDPEADVSQFGWHVPEDGVDATVSYMRTLSKAHEPGTTWNYSTGETNLIGILVSSAVNKPLSEYLSDKIWSKIGTEQDGSWSLNTTGNEISGCCIQANPKDFLRFGQFILNGAKVDGESIVPDDWFTMATTTQVAFTTRPGGYGFQWWTSDDGSYQGKGIYGQGIFIDPSKRLVVAVNGNWNGAYNAVDVNKLQELYKLLQTAVE